MKRYAIWIVMLFVLANNAFANVQTNIDSGLSWVLSNQNPDGSFGSQPELIFRDTQETLQILNLLNQKGTQFQNAFQWSVNTQVGNTDYIARKIVLLSNAGSDTTEGINLLLAYQNTDGGFGIASYGSDPFDTALALQALKSTNYLDQTVLQSAINYLLSSQNLDGGWGFYQGNESNVYITAIISMTLQQFPQTTAIASALNKATSHITIHQKADGGFGTSSSTVYETSLAYMAIAGILTDNTVLGKTVNYVASTQSADGSWSQDPYSTALALRALYISKNKPTPPPQPTTGAVSGTIVDATTNQPLLGASVALTSDPQTQTSTNAMGNFTLSNIPQGNQSILISLSGYTAITRAANIGAGSIINLGTVPLSSIPTAGIIKGTVTDAANGQPLQGVTISITGSFSGSTVTGVDGSYAISSVTPGTVTVTASKMNYYEVTGPGIVAAGGVLQFNPQLNTTPATGTTGNLTGKVFDSATNKPIQGSTVSISGNASVSSELLGVFNFANITPGTYNVTISAPGYANQNYQIMIIAGVTTDVQIVYLTQTPQTTTVIGIITDALSGAPIVNASLEVMGTSLYASTDSTGAYTITGINILNFDLKTSAIGYDSFTYSVTTITPGTYNINIALNPSKVSDVKIASLSTENINYPAASPVKILMHIANSGPADVKGTMLLEIISPEGSTIYADLIVNTGANQIDIASNAFDFTIGESTFETFWMTSQQTPGQYTVIVTLKDINNLLLDKKSTNFTIMPGKILSGNIYLDPFVAQANQPVNVKAKIRNAGNISIENANLTLSVTIQGGTTPLWVITKPLTDFPVGAEATIDYGSFIPDKGGIYNLQITPDKADVYSTLKTTISVGSYAMGTFSISPDKVSSGNQTIKGNIHLTADTQGLPPSVVPMEHNRVNVLFDSAYAPAIDISSEFAKIISDDGFHLYFTAASLTKDILKDVHILILPGTSDFGFVPYAQSEVDAIYDFVINGGGLFVIADHTGFGIPFEPIIERFGASFAGNNIGSNLYIYKEFISQCEITDGIQAIYQVSSGGCNSFSQLPPEAQILATYGGYNILAAIPEGGAAGKGRVVISSDINMFVYGNSASLIDQNPTDWYGIAIKGNSLFTRNAVRWLTPKVPVGIETTTSLVLPNDVVLSLPNPLPSNTIQLPNNLMEYDWTIPSVSTLGMNINFSLSFNDLRYGNIYPAAKDAFVSFVNTTTGNLVTVSLTIPTLQVDSFLNPTVSADKTTYMADENVNITTTITNNSSSVKSVTAHLIVEDQAGSQVNDVATFTVSQLEPTVFSGWAYRIPVPVMASWNMKDSLAKVVIDFAQELQTLGVSNKVVDKNSIRVLERDNSGNMIGEKQAQAVFDSDAKARVTWFLDGTTTKGTTRYFFVYFDITDHGPKQLLLNTRLPGSSLIAFADENGNIFSALSNGDGTFGIENVVEFLNNVGGTRGLVLDDFNGDGYEDIIAGFTSDGSIYYYQNKADGTNTFMSKIRIANVPPPGNSIAIASGDFNNDGYNDFVVSGDAAPLYLFKGKGDGTFIQTSLPAPPGACVFKGKAAADFNKDGNLDLVVTGTCGLYLYLGNGDGTFLPPVMIGYSGNEPYGVVAEDFDEDGNIDVIANSGPTGNPFIFKGNGDGTFGWPIPVWSLYTGGYAAYAVGDFNNDGHLDVIATNLSFRSIDLYTGKGDGTFNPQITIAKTPTSDMGISASAAPAAVWPILGAPEAVPSPVFNFLWNTGSTASGPYQVHVVLSEGGSPVSESKASFAILPDMRASANVVTDKMSYNPNEMVTVTSTVTSISTNHIFDNLTAKISIQNPGDGSLVYTETKSIATLMPEASFTFKSYWNTETYAPGTYPVTLEVKDASGTVIATGSSQIVISSTVKPSSLLKGQVSVDKQSVLSGESISVSYSVTNIGNIDLSSLNLSVQTVHVVNQTVYDTIPAQTPLPMGGAYPGTGVIDTAKYTAKDYLVVLRAKIGDIEETLAGTYFRVEGAPTAPSLSLPGNGSDVETFTPVLIVNSASDPNDDKLTYEFEVYGDSGLTNQVTGTSGQGTVWTVPVSLTENATYYWRSRAYDGKLYGSWMTTASFRVNVANDAPTAPGISSPGDGLSVDMLTPILTVTNAFDPDSASLTYNFDVALDPDFIQIVATVTGVTSGQGTTSWQVPAALTENTYYYWRAQADDWFITGPWMTTAKFFVNTANDAPTAPVITSPANNSEITTTSPDIVLINSTDPDSTVLTYYFELDTIMTFDSGNIIRSGSIPQGQGTTTCPVTGLKDNTQYFARAKASDGQAESPSWSGVNSFFVNTTNDAPTVPALANPSDKGAVNTYTPTLSVHNSTDPDKDILTYEFEVYSDSALTTLVTSTTGVSETAQTTSWTVPVSLIENQTYYWRARAYDGELRSDWMTPTSFMVNTANDAPGAPKLNAPAEGISLATLTPALSVTNAVDPDSDKLTYDFEIYAGDVLRQSITGVPQDSSGVTSATLSTALSDNTTYRWRARAYDGDRHGAWMDMATFSIHIPVTTINATIDFDPNTLNKTSNGTWVVVYIEFPAGYRPADVDISTVRLEGTIPAVQRPSAVGDYDKDGIPDLMVKFKRSDVINLLPNGDKVTVRVTGTVGTTTFEGVDTIRVIP